MSKSEQQVASWAVYQVTILGQPGPNVVCHQSEWDEIEKAQPGVHRLVRGGITNEGEAERLARGSSGDRQRAERRKEILQLLAAPPECSTEPHEAGETQEDDGPLLLPFSVPPQGGGESPAPGEPPHGRMESA